MAFRVFPKTQELDMFQERRKTEPKRTIDGVSQRLKIWQVSWRKRFVLPKPDFIDMISDLLAIGYITKSATSSDGKWHTGYAITEKGLRAVEKTKKVFLELWGTAWRGIAGGLPPNVWLLCEHQIDNLLFISCWVGFKIRGSKMEAMPKANR